MALLTFLVEDNPTIRDNLIPTLADLADAPVVGVADADFAWEDDDDDDFFAGFDAAADASAFFLAIGANPFLDGAHCSGGKVGRKPPA